MVRPSAQRDSLRVLSLVSWWKELHWKRSLLFLTMWSMISRAVIRFPLVLVFYLTTISSFLCKALFAVETFAAFELFGHLNEVLGFCYEIVT